MARAWAVGRALLPLLLLAVLLLLPPLLLAPVLLDAVARVGAAAGTSMRVPWDACAATAGAGAAIGTAAGAAAAAELAGFAVAFLHASSGATLAREAGGCPGRLSTTSGAAAAGAENEDDADEDEEEEEEQETKACNGAVLLVCRIRGCTGGLAVAFAGEEEDDEENDEEEAGLLVPAARLVAALSSPDAVAFPRKSSSLTDPLPTPSLPRRRRPAALALAGAAPSEYGVDEEGAAAVALAAAADEAGAEAAEGWRGGIRGAKMGTGLAGC